MDFSQLIFWRILIVALCAMKACDFFLKSVNPSLRRKLYFLILSWVMLGVISMETLGIFLLVSIVAYGLCYWQVRKSLIGPRVTLSFLIPVLLLPLFYYKYADFAVNGILNMDVSLVRDLVIPVGISFYSFQIIAFCIDTLIRKEEMPSLMDYLLFCSFFPQIVAGPIERKNDLLPQIQQFDPRIRAENLNTGLRYILVGIFFKSVLADNLAGLMRIGYDGNNGFVIWMNNLLFSMRIYFDFCGYGLSAYGLARCFNVTLKMNFWSPYTACNMTEFWRRWHITLTSWFRDYVYFPIKGSRTRRWWLNIIFVFLVSGIWHGAGWNFVIWGTLIGITMVIHRLFSTKGLGWRLPALLGWLVTITTMTFIWMFFYITDLDLLLNNLATLANFRQYECSFPLQGLERHLLVWVVAILTILTICLEAISMKWKNNPYWIFTHPIAIAIIMALVFIAQPGKTPSFIYFAF